MNRIIFLCSILAITVVSLSCKKGKEEKEVPSDNPHGNLAIKFHYAFAQTPGDFKLHQEVVHPQTGDTITFTNFKFYISNFKLKKADGTWWVHPESYYLADISDGDNSVFTIKDVPAGTYTAMEYVMGVDSTANVTGAQTGALSMAHGMFWDWLSGYIMVKAEGKSPQSVTKLFSFHLGGFAGEDNIVTVKQTNFNGQELKIADKQTAQISMRVNLATLWHDAPPLKDASAIHAPGPLAKKFATGFYQHGIDFSSID